MAYSVPSSRSTGDLCTAAIWNQDVVANPIAIYAGAMSVSSQAVGDILYASSTTQLGRIAAVATGQVLTSAGTGTVPAWSSNVDLGGTLDVTGATTLDSTLAVAGNTSLAHGTKLMLGSATSGIGGSTTGLQMNGVTGADVGVQMGRWSTNSGPATFSFVKSRGGAVGTEGIVSAADGLGDITWYGDDGTDQLTPAASIGAYVDSTPGENDMPGRIVFSSTPDGAAAVVERMKITSYGMLQLTDVIFPNFSTDGWCNMRISAPFIDLADDAIMTISCNTGVLFSVQYWAGSSLYYTGLFLASYDTNTIVELADASSAFSLGDTGSNYAVYKAVGAGTVSVKNRSGATRRTAIQSIELSGL